MNRARGGSPEDLAKLNAFRLKTEEESQEVGLTKKEILMVRDYMDQEKDNKIMLEELVDAFDRALQSAEIMKREEQVALVLGNLEDFMKGRNMRLMDLFLEMDADGSGSLSRQELRDALQRMCAPAVHKNRATELREKKAALARKKAAREDEERRLRQEAQKRMQDKLKRVKDAKIAFGRPSTRPGG